MSLGLEATHANKPTPDAKAVRTFDSYADAAQEAALAEVTEGFVMKIQRSPYGPGYVIRTLPLAFLTHPDLKNRMIQRLDYSDI